MFPFFPFMQQFIPQAARHFGFMPEAGPDPQGGQQMNPQMPPAGPEWDSLDPEEAQRHLRMLRARQSYEARFGQQHAGGSAASLAGGEQDMLARVRQAREMGWRS